MGRVKPAACWSRSPGLPVLPPYPTSRPAGPSAAQVSFEQATRDLASPDPAVRLRAAQLLKDAAYPEAAMPLAALVDRSAGRGPARGDRGGAEHLPRREDRAAQARRLDRRGAQPGRRRSRHFRPGRCAIGPRPVPMEVLTRCASAARDDNPRVALEALYAFGALAVGAGRRARGASCCATSGPDLAAMHRRVRSGAPLRGRPRHRPRVRAARAGRSDRRDRRRRRHHGAERRRPRRSRRAAMQALGAMRYERARPGADRSVPVLRQAATLAEARARRARAHRASVERCRCSTAQLSAKELGAARHRHRRAGADRRSRRSSPTIQTALDAERNDAVPLAGSVRRGAARRTGRSIAIADALDAAAAARPGAPVSRSSSRRAARAALHAPSAGSRRARCASSVADAARPERRSGGAAARRAAAERPRSAGRARGRTRGRRGCEADRERADTSRRRGARSRRSCDLA